MEFLSFIGGNHLFRYSFTLGLAMVIFAVLYPLQKKNDLQLEQVKYYEDLAILKIETEDLVAKAERLSKVATDLSTQSVGKRRINGRIIKENLRKIQAKQFSADLKALGDNAKIVKLKNAKVDNIYMKIDILQKQIDELNIIAWALKIVGSALAAYGFYYWRKGALTGNPDLTKA